MVTITIPKKEYRQLLDNALRYEYLRQIMEGNIFSSPPTKNIKEIVGSFRATKIYNQRFIKSLEKGFKRSSYFKI